MAGPSNQNACATSNAEAAETAEHKAYSARSASSASIVVDF
jgi:hypothetical protein